ncbi:hypothetical protein CMV24_05425 [Pseudomonas plecoglossicida]|uniref:Uncharacterized protein n=1 Tax=Pseudomonas plecoglossicida TaxID=70775 RepID=A0A2A3M7S8_PSEDL|nr:hypothetical protein CMV24_05425 [Pseudomonas plecoglossicida]
MGAGVPANQATRWLAPAAPVFAGKPAPTPTAQVSRSLSKAITATGMAPARTGRYPRGRLPSPFGLRCRAENKYRSPDASVVGAALCCEEAGTSNRLALSVPRSCQRGV